MALDTINALITLEELKKYLAVDQGDEFVTDETNDDELENTINEACQWANEYTGVDLLAREHTEYYDGDGTRELFLDNFPILSTAAEIELWIDHDRQYEDSDKIEASAIIVYSKYGKITLDDDAFDKGPQSIKIVYTAGHGAAADPTNVKADIKLAIKLICASIWKTKVNKLTMVASQTLEGSSFSAKDDSFPVAAKEILDNYAREKWSISN